MAKIEGLFVLIFSYHFTMFHSKISVITTTKSAPATKKMIVDAILEDEALRHPGVNTGIHRLSCLNSFARLGHGVPMIRSIGQDIKSRVFNRAADDCEFRRRLRAEAPYLENFNLKYYGLRLAGGAVSTLLMNTKEDRDLCGSRCLDINDYDLFLVGHKNDLDAQNAIHALRTHLVREWGGDEQSIRVYRTQGCITFCSRNPGYVDAASAPYSRIVQVILRRYATDAEVIHGFDLGSSAFLWNGEYIIMTTLGKIAAEHGANILNLKARRNSYESRLARYFERGFDLILPDLDVCSFTALGGRLPYLYAEKLNGAGCACTLTARSLFATRPGYDKTGRIRDQDDSLATDTADAPTPVAMPAFDPAPAAGGSDYSLGHIAYGHERVIMIRNAKALDTGSGHTVASLCASAPLTPRLDIFSIEPAVDALEMASIVKWSFLGDAVKVNTIKKVLGAKLAGELLVEFINTNRPPSDEKIRDMCEARRDLLNQKAHIPFAFMTVEDKTALTGPFPRSLVSREQWYGDAIACRS